MIQNLSKNMFNLYAHNELVFVIIKKEPKRQLYLAINDDIYSMLQSEPR